MELTCRCETHLDVPREPNVLGHLLQRYTKAVSMPRKGIFEGAGRAKRLFQPLMYNVHVVCSKAMVKKRWSGASIK